MRRIMSGILAGIIIFTTCGCCTSQEVVAEEIAIEEEVIEEDYGDLAIPPYEPMGYRGTAPAGVPQDLWIASVIWGMEYCIAPEFLCSIANTETLMRNINSANGLYIGIMQIHPGSHRKRMERLGVTDLTDVNQNVRVAADYLAELFEEYEDPAIVLMKYHGEPQSNIDRCIQTGWMSYYAKTIIKFSAELERREGI